MMIKHSALAGYSLSFLLVILAIFPTIPLNAQFSDDPNRDQIPFYLRDRLAPGPGDVPLSSVVTVNHFDNYNLAVDFAESNMAENPLQPAWFFTAYNTNAAHNTQDGLTWANSTPSFGTTVQGDPVVTCDSLGNLIYENMYGPSSIQGCKVLVSSNNGVSWGSPVTAIAGVDKNWIAADQTAGPYSNYIYTTMTASSGGNFARSTDHGVTFQTTFNATTQSLPGMMVCVGPNGNTQGGSVYVVTNSGSAFASTYTFYRSTDGGSTFSQMSAQSFSGYVGTNVGGRNSVQNMRTRPYPMIAADNSFGTSRGRLYCVYASNDPPGNANKPDIWCRYSDNGGTTWSSAILVNDDVNPQSHHQWHPAIWCDKQTGRLYAMWMDTRDCPTSDSALIYASYSDNGGVTWAANQPVSNQKMKIDCPTCGGGGTPRYQGDYNGIVSNKKVAMAGWTDFRQGSFISMTGYFPDFALSVNKTADTLVSPNDSADFLVSVPAVKLYSDTVVLSGQVTPAPSTGSITFIYPAGSQITSFPGSRTVRVKLTGNVPAGSYQASFFAKGPNGTPVHVRTATLTVQAAQVLSVLVTANPVTVCNGGSTQLQATVGGGTAPYTYSWTSNPPGFTSTQPAPTATPTVTTRYKCTVHDNVNSVVADSVLVTVTATPATPGTITGNDTVCEGTTQGYSIAPVTGATTYTWTVPAGSTILSGQGSTMVSVLAGPLSGNITVNAGNSCGSSASSVFALTVSPLPAAPSPVSGPSSVCEGDTAGYSVPVSGLTNNWSVPAGSIILNGQGTPAITVVWGANSGTVSVTAQNSCGNSSPGTLQVSVLPVPAAPQAIDGPDTVCQGGTGYQFSVPAISNATSYFWELPSGAIVTQGQGTNEITVNFSNNAASGDISVSGTNSCGTGPSGSKYLEVVVCTGIHAGFPNAVISIYPNPARDHLNLSVKNAGQSISVRINDIRGQLLYRSTLENAADPSVHRIDLSGFAHGVYIITLTSDTGIYTGKITVQ